MNLATSVLGSTTVKRLEQAGGEHVLIVGNDKLTRGDLAKVGCYNFAAAKNLTRALADWNITNLKQLFHQVPPWQFAVPHVGVITLAVLGAAFEAKGIGGESPLETYAQKHADGAKRALVTFDTYKHQQQREAAAERKAKRKRKAERRNQAHTMRVNRFESRLAAAHT